MDLLISDTVFYTFQKNVSIDFSQIFSFGIDSFVFLDDLWAMANISWRLTSYIQIVTACLERV